MKKRGRWVKREAKMERKKRESTGEKDGGHDGVRSERWDRRTDSVGVSEREREM